MAYSSLSGRTYIVTGGGSGIGLQTVRGLLEASAVVHAIDLKTCPPIEFESWTGQKLHYHGAVDVSSREHVNRVYNTITSISPHIDGLVNCAGICPGGGDTAQADEVFLATMAVNVTGTWNTTTALLKILDNAPPHGTQQNRASIVNLGSSASLCPWPTLAAYTASKHAVLGLTRSWSLDYARRGIRVNLVAPGGTDTPLARAQLEEMTGRGEALTAGLSIIPMGRMGEAREQADAILFLLSDNSSYITGQYIAVNGGYP